MERQSVLRVAQSEFDFTNLTVLLFCHSLFISISKSSEFMKHGLLWSIVLTTSPISDMNLAQHLLFHSSYSAFDSLHSPMLRVNLRRGFRYKLKANFGTQTICHIGVRLPNSTASHPGSGLHVYRSFCKCLSCF